MENIDHSFARYKGRLLSVSMDDDLYAPRKAVDCLTQKYSQENVTRWHILPSDLNIKALGHPGFFIAEDRNKVFLGGCNGIAYGRQYCKTCLLGV